MKVNTCFGDPKDVTFGEGTYADEGVEVHQFDATPLTVGKYCSIARGVQFILGGLHNTQWVTTYPFGIDGKAVPGHPKPSGPLNVGSDVWIGAEAMILSPTLIGDGAVISARSVVHSHVPPYAIAAGNPAGVIGYRFEPRIVAQLLGIAWWDWPRERIEKAVPLLTQPDIGAFIAAVKEGKI